MNDKSKDKYRFEFAVSTAAAARETYSQAFATAGSAGIFSEEDVYQLIEAPKDPTMGRFAMPVFRSTKLLGESPQVIVNKLAPIINVHLRAKQSAVQCNGVGGYLNASISQSHLAREVCSEIVDEKKSFGSSALGNGEKVLIEYSSPNIAKPFGVGHLRSTAIGNSLCRIFRKLGYDVIGINFPGDWGTQFGKMIVAFKRWGDASTLEGDAVSKLLELYVKFHTEVELDKSLDDEARKAFQLLEGGDSEAVALWQQFKRISHAEFDRIYSRLGVQFDLVIGESFFNDKMDAAIERLYKAHLTTESQGALIVDLQEPNLPPALLRKRDGATLYTTRDLAGLIYRWDTYHFHESLYVVGSSQSDHFKVCLKVIEKLEAAEGLSQAERMTGRVKHIDFGWVKFGDKTMSTRRGNIVLLDQVIDTAVERVTSMMREKNPTLSRLEQTAEQIGVGAVIFSQLSVRRQTDVNFVWEQVLNFEGETGPYLQYTHARLASLLRNYNKPVTATVDFQLLEGDEERRIIELLADYPTIVEDSARQYDPFVVASYLFRLAAAFNKFYQRKDADGKIDRIILETDPARTAARMLLVESMRTVIADGLHLLGLSAPDEM